MGTVRRYLGVAQPGNSRRSTRNRFPSRVLKRLVDPTVAAVPIAVGLLWLLRSHGLIANLHVWVLFLLVGGCSILAAVANEVWPVDLSGWRLYMRVGIELTGITVRCV